MPDQIGVDRVRAGPVRAEYEAEASAQRADTLGTGDQPDGRIARAGLDHGDLQLGARADRPSGALEEESIHRSVLLNVTIPVVQSGRATMVSKSSEFLMMTTKIMF